MITIATNTKQTPISVNTQTLKRGQLARQAAGMGAEWLPNSVDPIADLIRERVQDWVDHNSHFAAIFANLPPKSYLPEKP